MTQGAAYPPPMMTMHVVSSVSGRSASGPAPDVDRTLADVIVEFLSGSPHVDVGEEEGKGFSESYNSKSDRHHRYLQASFSARCADVLNAGLKAIHVRLHLQAKKYCI
jgi:hypothetical protein